METLKTYCVVASGYNYRNRHLVKCGIKTIQQAKRYATQFLKSTLAMDKCCIEARIFEENDNRSYPLTDAKAFRQSIWDEWYNY